MSFAPSGYVVNLEKITGAYGSKKSALVSAVVKKHAKDIAHNSDWFSEEIAAGAPTLDAALREIVDGKCTKRQHGFQYVYACELLCKQLGTCLFAAEFINCGYLEALASLWPKTGPIRKLLSPGTASDRKPAILAIPRQKDAVPGIGYYDAAEAKLIAKTLAEIELDPTRKYGKHTGVDLEGGFTEVKEWFQHASKARSGLMMFWY